LGLLTFEVLGAADIVRPHWWPAAALAVAWLAVALPDCRPRPSRRWVPLVLLTVWAGASLLWSVDPLMTASAAARLLLATTLAAVLLSHPESAAHGRAIQRGAAGALVALALALLLSVSGFNGYGRLSDALPTSQNGLAFRLLAAALLALPGIPARLRAPTVVAVSLLLGMVSSRGVFLAWACAGAVWWVFDAGSLKARRKAVLIGMACAFAASLGVSAVSGARDVRRRIELHRPDTPGTVLNGRETLWAYSRDMLEDNPVTGVGMQGFRTEYGLRRTAGIAAGRRKMAVGYTAHSYWAELASGLGLPGLALGLVVALQMLLKVPRAGWPAAGVFAAWLVVGLVEDPFTGFVMLFLPAAVMPWAHGVGLRPPGERWWRRAAVTPSEAPDG